MSDLKSLVCEEPTRGQLVDDCVRLVDQEVSMQRGVSGLAIKGAYKAVKKLKPGFVRAAVDGLLDGWLEKMEPFYKSWDKDEKSFETHLTPQSHAVADALLEVTDRRAEISKYKSAAKMYSKLRPSAQSHVSKAVPKLAQLVEKRL